MDDETVTSPNSNTEMSILGHKRVKGQGTKKGNRDINLMNGLNTDNTKEQKLICGSIAKDINDLNKEIMKDKDIGYELLEASSPTNKHKERYEANKDAIKERSRKRYEANKEAIKERSRAKYAANRDKAKARYEANKDIFKERAKRKYEANKDAIKERSTARYAANRAKAKVRCVAIKDNIKDLSSAIYDENYKLEHDEVEIETKQEINAIYRLQNIEEIKAKQNPRYTDKAKAKYEPNKDIIKDLTGARYDTSCKSTQNRVVNESEKEIMETNSVCRLQNVEEIKEKQKPKYADKKKARYEANKDIIKERSRKRYWANNDILKERARAKYAANKNVRERNRSYYKANKDHINEQKRARRAAKSDDTKAKLKANKIIEETRNIERKVKCKRKLKMWTPEEEAALVSFLKQNIEFLKPTARVYYNRFLQSSGVNADWRMVRSKMFTMRKTYKKTKEWLNNVGNAKANNRKIRNTVLSKCRFYYDFEKFFGSNSFNVFQFDNILSDTIRDQKSKEASITIVKTENEAFEIYYNKMPSISHDNSFLISETLSSHQTIKNFPKSISTNCCSGVCLCLIVSGMIQSRTEILTLGMKQMKFDTIFREKQMQLQERQVAVQEKELEFKEKELKSQEHLKLLELEMKEKLAITELELRYKNKNELN